MKLHLAECEPEKHPEWSVSTFAEATGYGMIAAPMCKDTEYMAEELYPDETVWIEEE